MRSQCLGLLQMDCHFPKSSHYFQPLESLEAEGKLKSFQAYRRSVLRGLCGWVFNEANRLPPPSPHGPARPLAAKGLFAWMGLCVDVDVVDVEHRVV